MDGDRTLPALPGPGAAAGTDGREVREEHFANFIDAVRSTEAGGPERARSRRARSRATLVHLANITYRLGRTLHWDAKKMECTGDAEANRMLTRDYRKPYVVPEQV